MREAVLQQWMVLLCGSLFCVNFAKLKPFPRVPFPVWFQVGLARRDLYWVWKAEVKQQPRHTEGQCRAPRATAAPAGELLAHLVCISGSGTWLYSYGVSYFNFPEAGIRCSCSSQAKVSRGSRLGFMRENADPSLFDRFQFVLTLSRLHPDFRPKRHPCQPKSDFGMALGSEAAVTRDLVIPTLNPSLQITLVLPDAPSEQFQSLTFGAVLL